MRKVLIIAYEFPPSAGGGVQRIAKFARYLSEFGWEPTVLCAEPVPGRPRDETLLSEIEYVTVVRTPALNIAHNVQRFYAPLKRLRAPRSSSAGTGGGAASEGSVTAAPVSTRVVRRFWTDSAHYWSAGVPRIAQRLHRESHFDAIIASGPPPSVLKAGSRAAIACGLPFVADFRDAWATSPDFRWPRNARLDSRSVAWERAVVEKAELITVVSEPIADEVRSFGADNVLVLPNGFDPRDLPPHSPSDGPLRIAFMGRFYGITDPTPFFDGAAQAVRDYASCNDLVIEVLGQVSDVTREAIAQRGLESHVRYHGFLPHAHALRTVAGADLGLVALADHPGSEANYTGKLFEYLGMGLPILVVGPEHGVAAELVREARAGVAVPYSDPSRVASELDRLAREKAEGVRSGPPDPSIVARFDRRTQVQVLAGRLDEIAKESAIA